MFQKIIELVATNLITITLFGTRRTKLCHVSDIYIYYDAIQCSLTAVTELKR